MELKDLIKKQRQALGLTLMQVANATNVSEATVSRWESGSITSIKQSRLQALAKILELSIQTLLDTDDTLTTLSVPILGYVAGGIPIDAIENIIGYEELPSSYNHNDDFFGLKVKGHSMMPQICDGDTVIVRKQNTIENGEVGIILIENNEATCKRIIKQDDGIMLVSYNNEFLPMFYSNDDIANIPLTIIGKVVELRRNF